MAEAPHCSGACACSAQGVNLSINPPAIHTQIGEQARTRSLFHVPGMDCAAEEQMIRLRLAEADRLAGAVRRAEDFALALRATRG